MELRKPIMWFFLWLLLNGQLGFAGNAENKAQDNSLPEQTQKTLSQEEREIIQDLDLLENLDVLQDGDMEIFEDYERIEKLDEE